MVFCAVTGCSNNSQKTEGVSYFRFPSERGHKSNLHSKCSKRLSLWLKALKRADMTMSKIQHERICSTHFITGVPANLYDEQHPDWVPTLNLGDSISKEFNDSATDSEDEMSSENESPILVGTTCIINSCRNNLLETRKAGLNISYYRFPLDEELLLKWKDRCKLKNKTIPKSARICSEHFKHDDFNHSTPGSLMGKRDLKHGVIPSINLSNSQNVNTASEFIMIKTESLDENSDENWKSEPEDYEEEIKVRIAPMCYESSSDEAINCETERNKNKRKINSTKDVSEESDSCTPDIHSSDDSYIDSEDEWKPISLKKVKPTTKKRKIFDYSAAELEYETSELTKCGKVRSYPYEQRDNSNDSDQSADENPLGITQSLASLLKKGKMLPDKETIIKVLEQQILEHSKIIEENNIQLYMRGKRGKRDMKNTQNTIIAQNNETNHHKDIPNIVENNVQFEKVPLAPVENSEVIQNEETFVIDEKINDTTSDDIINITLQPKPKTHIEPKEMPTIDASSYVHINKFEALQRKYDALVLEKANADKCILNLKEHLKAKEKELEGKREELNFTILKHDEVSEKLTKMEGAVSKMLTPNQIKLLLNSCKKVSWTPQEMLSAFTIRFLSRRCYYYLRQKLNYPLPGISSVQRWAAVMTKQHGNFRVVQKAINQISAGDSKEDDSVLFFPDASDDVIVEGTIDEINAHSDDPIQNNENIDECDVFLSELNDQKIPMSKSANQNNAYNENIIFLKEVDCEITHEDEDGEQAKLIEVEESDAERKSKCYGNCTHKFSENGHTLDNSLLKALLIGEPGSECDNNGEQMNAKQVESQHLLKIIQDQVNCIDPDYSQKVIVLHTYDGETPEGVHWQLATAEDSTEENNESEQQYYIADEGETSEAMTYIEDEEHCRKQEVLEGDTEKNASRSDDQRNAIAVFNQEALEDGNNSDEILHYLYGITEMSPLTLNNSIDHSYAIATLDKYIRTKERHKNRKPPKKQINIE